MTFARMLSACGRDAVEVPESCFLRNIIMMIIMIIVTKLIVALIIIILILIYTYMHANKHDEHEINKFSTQT